MTTDGAQRGVSVTTCLFTPSWLHLFADSEPSGSDLPGAGPRPACQGGPGAIGSLAQVELLPGWLSSPV